MTLQQLNINWDRYWKYRFEIHSSIYSTYYAKTIKEL